MAGEEDVELRDLVAQTLEAKGVLGKIRAQLRASVFLALEEQESQQRPNPLVSSRLEQFQKSKEGKIVTALVREFLDYFELEYTRSVFDPEANASEIYPGRERLARDLNLDPQATSPSGPLLAHLVQHALSPTSASRQLKFPDSIPSSHTVTSGTPHLPTTVISDVSRAAVAVSSTGPSFPFTGAAPPTLHSAQLGTSTALQGHTRSENDSEHIISHNFSQLNDKHFKLPASVADLNSNENSNADGGGHKSSVTNVASHQLKSDISGTPGPVGVEGLGVGLSGLQVHEAYAELGETFVNSADSSLDVDKLINTSTGSERLRELLKPSSGGGREVSREELDDFFDSSLPSALHDSKEKDSLRDGVLDATKGKSSPPGEDGAGGAYEDDFHSDPSSRVSEHLEEPSLPLETEDVSFSQTSLPGTMDYIEPVHS